jgi:hypothetical protein
VCNAARWNSVPKQIENQVILQAVLVLLQQKKKKNTIISIRRNRSIYYHAHTHGLFEGKSK